MPAELDFVSQESFNQDDIIFMLGQAALLRLSERLDSYRDILRLTYDRDRGGTKPRSLEALGQNVPPASRRIVEKAIRALPTDLLEALEETSASDHRSSPEGKRHPYSYEQLIVGAMLQIGKSKYEKVIEPFLSACESDEYALAYGLGFLRWKHRSHADELARAVIPMAVSAFETFFAEVLRTWYLLHRQKLEGNERQVKLGKLLAYASMDDQLRFIIDELVEDILKQSPHEWQKKLGSDGPNLNVETVGCAWHEFCEIFARRNALIHNDDRADERYLKRTPWIQPPREVGAHLGTDWDYAMKTLTVLRAQAEAIAISVLAQLIPQSENLEALVIHLSFEALREEHWSDVVTITAALLESDARQHEFHEIRINQLMARMKLGDNVREEVAALVAPPGESRIALGIAALKGDTAATIAALQTCKQEANNMRQLADWPVLTDLARSDRRIQQELQRYRQHSSASVPRGRRKKPR